MIDFNGENVNAKTYWVYDATTLYVYAEIQDADHKELAEDANIWDDDEFELFFDWTNKGEKAEQHRIQRTDGILSDSAGNTGKEVDEDGNIIPMNVTFDGKAKEVTGGWCAELAFPLPASKNIGVSGFVQDSTTWGLAREVCTAEGAEQGNYNQAKTFNYITLENADLGNANLIASDAIVLDGEKDEAYADAPAMVYGRGTDLAVTTGTSYYAFDGSNLYVYTEVTDATKYTFVEGNAAWEDDCIEYFVDWLGTGTSALQYRVGRAGVLSDAAGKTGDEMAVAFNATVKEIEGGWAAEAVFPVPEKQNDTKIALSDGSVINVSGFVQNVDADWAVAYGAPSVWVYDTYNKITLSAGKASKITLTSDEITLDAEKDAAYDKGAYVDFTDRLAEDAPLSGAMSFIHDGENLYIWAEVQDTTPYEMIEGDAAWNSDNVELLINWDGTAGKQYRVERSGICSDTSGATGADMVVTFDGKTKEVEGGWVAEIVIPIPEGAADVISIHGSFIQNFNYEGFTHTIDSDGKIVYDDGKNPWSATANGYNKFIKDLTFDYSAEIGKIADNTIALDASKDNAYDVGTVVDFSRNLAEDAPLSGTMTFLYDSTNLYVWAEVQDTTPYEMIEGDAAWNSDNVELLINWDGTAGKQYRVERSGICSDTSGATGADMVVTFDGKTKEVEGGWVAEIVIPIPEGAADVISIHGSFIQNFNYEGFTHTIDSDGKIVYDDGKNPWSATANGWNSVVKSLAFGAEVSVECPHAQTTEKVTAPTFDKEGKIETICDQCGEVVKTETIAKVQNKFSDVNTSKWYADAVAYALYTQIMEGDSATTFKPNDATNRAMLVRVLYNLEGSPDVSSVKLPFTDVEAGRWYTNAIKWAYSNEIVKGMTTTTYKPEDSITREQFATILYRYAQYKDVDVTITKDAPSFPDSNQVSKFAKEAIEWATATELISGTKAGDKILLNPNGNATKAEMATILMRYMEG